MTPPPTGGSKPTSGPKQEIFLVIWMEYFRRPDLQFTGRTISGKLARDLVLPVVMAVVVAVIVEYGGLLRMSIVSPGNDFSLGAMEALSAITSTYFSKDLTAYLKVIRNDEDTVYVPGKIC